MTVHAALFATIERLPRPVQRLIWLAVITPSLGWGMLLWTASPAAADDGRSNAPAALSWIKIKDGHDIDIWNYELSLDRGGMTNPGKLIWSFMTELCWGIYLVVISLVIWFIDWVLGFAWLDVMTKPVMRIGDALTVVVSRFGLVPTLLTITAMVAVSWMMRGKWVTGIFELFLSLVIASLAVGALSNPVQLVAGQNGLLYDSRDLGLAISSGLANDGDTSASGETVRKSVTKSMAETFVRQPAQIINFGAVLDGGKCEDEYTDVVKDGPYGGDDDIRDAVSDCDSKYGDVAENPNSGMAMSSFALFPAALVMLVLGALLAGTVLVAGIYALYNALKLIVALITGMLPGGARGSLWLTVADLVVSLVTLVFSVVFLGAFLLLIQAVFASGDEGSRMETFFIVDFLILAGIIVFWKGRKRLKASADRLAQAMNKRPGGGQATALPARGSGVNAAEIYYKSQMALGAARAVTGRGRARGAGEDRAPADQPSSGPSPTPAKAPQPSGDQSPRPEHSGPETLISWGEKDPAGAPQRVRERMATSSKAKQTAGTLVRVGATVAAAAATGGTTAAVQVGTKSAAKAAATAAGRRALGATPRRAALTARLSAPQPPAAPTGPQSRRKPSQAAEGAPREALSSRPGSPQRSTPAATASPRPPSSPSAKGFDRVVTSSGQVALVPRPDAPSPQAEATQKPSSPAPRPVTRTQPQSVPAAATPRPRAAIPPGSTSSGEAAERLRARLGERRGTRPRG